MRYPDYPAGPGELEAWVLERWREEDLLGRTLQATAGGPEFVFYEGPPTANGRPGIHHVLSRTLKDIICRFRTMQGRHVTRIAGWDTHGLPVEIEAEKRLGISGKRQIEELGVARFNQVCRESVFTYKEDWERLSERIGYWLDYSKPYVTFTPDYIESVWWILKQLYEKGLIYRGYKSIAYCPRCGTALSSHEVAQGYEDVDDPSLFFLAPLLDDTGRETETAFLVWTTTPWTLPSNVALAVHPDLEYAEVAHQGRRLLLASTRVTPVLGEDARILARHRAADLIGRRYAPPFQIIPVGDGAEQAWQVVAGDFVSAGEGTGIVHLAPAFGADDFAAGQQYGLPMLRPIGDDGHFEPGVPLVGGMWVKDADAPLVDDLRRRGLVFRYGLERHSYPHCWRCGSPLIYMARDSWYIRTTAYREAMVRNNAGVGWHPPEVGTGRMGEWLEGNVDWAISRERYWGTPLPIWVCDLDPEHQEAIGSLAELSDRLAGGDAAAGLPAGFDPHKPQIDEPTWPCARCGGTMRRTPEVIDVWFDSGSMPYAQWHYPFENTDRFQQHWPADYICEGIDQTRGWFYSLLAISTLLERGSPYRNVIVNDLVLDAEGQKMSKSRGNVVDPWQALEALGADAIRWYFITGSQPWVPKRFDPAVLGEAARRVFDTLGNTYKFFALYAGLEGWEPSAKDPDPGHRPELDRWVLSRLDGLCARVTEDLEAYDVTRAFRAVGDFIVDDLSNWYVRRSRDRFWGTLDSGASRAAFRTLYDALLTVARLLAPVTPFQPDWLHRALTAGESVHLARFPSGGAGLIDQALEREMQAVRMLARLGRAARERSGIRVRQPLRRLSAVLPDGQAVRVAVLDVLKDELNVKEVLTVADAAEVVALRAEPDFRTLGPRLGSAMGAAAAAIRALTSEQVAELRAGHAVAMEVAGRELRLTADDVVVREEPRGELIIESDEGYIVALDPSMDDALRREGLARELVNRVQRLRRDSGLEVSDRIRLGIRGDDELLSAAAMHGDYIARETLASELWSGTRWEADAYVSVRDVELDGLRGSIGLSPVET
jgi:isoleucyl-tRNA synthetase